MDHERSLNQHEYPIQFTGKAGEFFRIWSVNLLLSIVTLGIYSAWAKVRTRQYFYGNTSIDSHFFRYLAKPLQILKGRLIAFAIFAFYIIASSFNPIANLILSAVLLFAFPWLLIQGIRFNMRMTSYRNVRFGFHGSYGKAFLTFIVLPVASVFTLHLALPWVMKKMDQFIHENISYGKQPIHLKLSTGTYYIAAFACVGLALVFGLIFLIVFGVSSIATIVSQQGSAPVDMIGNMINLAFVALVYWLLLSFIGAVYRAVIRNHLFASMQIENVCGFYSEVKALPYAWLMFSNTVITIISLGLAYPVAAVRKVRYLASVTSVLPRQNAATVIENQQNSSVFGEEASDLFDVDFAVG